MNLKKEQSLSEINQCGANTHILSFFFNKKGTFYIYTGAHTNSCYKNKQTKDTTLMNGNYKKKKIRQESKQNLVKPLK